MDAIVARAARPDGAGGSLTVRSSADPLITTRALPINVYTMSEAIAAVNEVIRFRERLAGGPVMFHPIAARLDLHVLKALGCFSEDLREATDWVKSVRGW